MVTLILLDTFFIDQLARAAGLVCALELERAKNTARYGEWPFEIDLWVGKAATPNILGHMGDGRSDSARTKIVASTATVRRAQDQIQALFARQFPPPGPDRRDSFFARTVPRVGDGGQALSRNRRAG